MDQQKMDDLHTLLNIIIQSLIDSVGSEFECFYC